MASMYADMAATLPNVVWCRECHNSQRVNPAECLRFGWPKCCGATMTIDQPRILQRCPVCGKEYKQVLRHMRLAHRKG